VYTALTDKNLKPIDKKNALQVDATLSNGIAAEYITDTAAHVPGTGYVFCAIYFLTDSVVTAIVPTLTGGTFTTVSITAQSYLYQELTSITLASGTAIAYRRPV